MNTITIFFCLLTINALCYFVFVSYRKGSKSTKDSKRLALVSGCLAAAIFQIAFGFIAFCLTDEFSQTIRCWSVASWTIGVLLIPTLDNKFRFLALPARIVICSALAIVIVNTGNEFSDSLDRFTIATLANQLDAVEPAKIPTLTGIDVSDALTPSRVFWGVVFFTHAFLISSFYGFAIRSRIDELKPDSDSVFRSDALRQVIFVLSFCLASLIAFLAAGGNGIGLGVFSGFIAIAASVALKDMLQNFVAGLMMLWEKSISIGDVISLDEQRYGVVKSITMRYMLVQDRNDITYMIPHSQLINANIENWTKAKGMVRLKLDIGIGYGSDRSVVREIMRSVPHKVRRVLSSEDAKPTIIGLDDSAIHYQLRFRIEDPDNGIRNVMSEVYEYLLTQFEAAKIEIPFPQRVVHIQDSAASKGNEVPSTHEPHPVANGFQRS